MSTPVEYLFVATFAIADQAARKQAQWNKPDGTVVCFICLEEQLAIVPADATVYVVGVAAGLWRFERKLVKLVA
jgi:hypothetical protein